MSAHLHRPLRRIAVAGAAGAAVLLALPTAAGAHVEAEAETTAGVTTIEFGFHHGCDGAATTSLRVQLPEGATDVEPEDPAGWTSEVSGGELVWTGGSIADGEDGNFVATMTLVDPEGTTVFLPTIQGCTGGAEAAWIDKSEDPEADNAAPRITAGAAAPTGGHDEDEDEGGHGSSPTTVAEKTTNEAGASTTSTGAVESATASPATESASSTSSSNAPLIIGIIAAVVVIGGLIAFFVTRKATPSDSGPSST
jgi:uncharacterized protein YcnI